MKRILITTGSFLFAGLLVISCNKKAVTTIDTNKVSTVNTHTRAAGDVFALVVSSGTYGISKTNVGTAVYTASQAIIDASTSLAIDNATGITKSKDGTRLYLITNNGGANASSRKKLYFVQLPLPAAGPINLTVCASLVYPSGITNVTDIEWNGANYYALMNSVSLGKITISEDCSTPNAVVSYANAPSPANLIATSSAVFTGLAVDKSSLQMYVINQKALPCPYGMVSATGVGTMLSNAGYVAPLASDCGLHFDGMLYTANSLAPTQFRKIPIPGVGIGGIAAGALPTLDFTYN